MTSTDLFSAMHGLAQESYLILSAIRDLFQIFMILRVLNLQTLAIDKLDNLPVSPSINFVTLWIWIKYALKPKQFDHSKLERKKRTVFSILPCILTICSIWRVHKMSIIILKYQSTFCGCISNVGSWWHDLTIGLKSEWNYDKNTWLLIL